MAGDEVSVIALVENLELAVPNRLPSPGYLGSSQVQRFKKSGPTVKATDPGNRDSNISVKRQLNLDVAKPESSAEKKSSDLPVVKPENLELLRRLPSGTVLIKEVDDKTSKNTDAIETATSTTSTVDRIRRLTQKSRNKKTLEVRRNPLRSAARKDFKDGARVTTSRQRLLAGRRRAAAMAAATAAAEAASGNNAGNKSSTESIYQAELTLTTNKRSRTGNYMNTRSVTRKMHSVGATYEAPTWRDFIEWKEWPAHGMHERPVYHPQFGLAAEYNGRLFASFDGEKYRELGSANTPFVEVVRVDPRVDTLDSTIPSMDFQPSIFQPPNSVTPSQYSAAAVAVARQKLGLGSISNSLYSRITERLPKVPGLFDSGAIRQPAYETSHSSHYPTQQEQQQQRQHHRRIIDERLQQNLQRLQQQTKNSPSRLLSKEVFKNLHAQKTTQQSPSKCLIMPRTHTTTPVTMPFYGVSNYKRNSLTAFKSFQTDQKNKLVFLRAPELPKKPLVEKTSTITSSTQSSTASWSEITNFSKKLDPSPLIENNLLNWRAVRKNWNEKLDPLPISSIPESLTASTSNKNFSTRLYWEDMRNIHKQIEDSKLPNWKTGWKTMTNSTEKFDSSSTLSSVENSSTNFSNASNSNNISYSGLGNLNRFSRVGRYFTPVRLPESTSIYRPSTSLSNTSVKLRDGPGLNSATCDKVESGCKSSNEPNDPLSEVLDLSKKEPSKMVVKDAKVKDDENGILVECC